MRSVVSDLNGLRRGHVSIVAAQATSTDFLPHAIAELKNRFPRVSFDCDFTGTANVIPRLIDGTADIGVAFQSSSDIRVPLALSFMSIIIWQERVQFSSVISRTNSSFFLIIQFPIEWSSIE